MSSLDVIHKLRQRLHATAAAKPNQWHTGVAMLRFLALMLLLTLLVRGTAATTLPVVSVTAPYQGVVTQSFTVSGQISPGIGTPLTIPEGLLVEQIFVQPGDPVTEGQTLALLSLDDVRAEIEQVQASMQQHQVQANQLLAGQAADPFAWQQAQQQLDRAYADYQQAAAEGEADVSQAQNVLDAAHQVLAEVEGRKPQRPYEDGFWEMATPEQAQTEQDYADWEAEYDCITYEGRLLVDFYAGEAEYVKSIWQPDSQFFRFLCVIAPSTITQRKRKNWLSQTKLIKRALRFC